MYKTSVNLCNEIFLMMNVVKNKYGISKSDLIRKILFLCNKNLNSNKQISGLSRYQPASESGWKCFQIAFSKDECDDVFLSKFKYRISLSKLIFIGFYLFIDDILDDLEKEKENVFEVINSYVSKNTLIQKYLYYEVSLIFYRRKLTKT